MGCGPIALCTETQCTSILFVVSPSQFLCRFSSAAFLWLVPSSAASQLDDSLPYSVLQPMPLRHCPMTSPLAVSSFQHPSTFVLHQDAICSSSSFSFHPAFPYFALLIIFSFLLFSLGHPGPPLSLAHICPSPRPGRSFTSVTHVCPCHSVFWIPHVTSRLGLPSADSADTPFTFTAHRPANHGSTKWLPPLSRFTLLCRRPVLTLSHCLAPVASPLLLHSLNPSRPAKKSEPLPAALRRSLLCARALRRCHYHLKTPSPSFPHWDFILFPDSCNHFLPLS